MARIRKTQASERKAALKKAVWRIALYIRLSKDDGNDESLSVTNQKKILMEFLEKFFDDEYVVVDVYVDDGLTGTDYERPDFQRMIHDVEIGKVNCIVCKNLSRAFRNYSDQGYFLENFFPIHNTRFITLGDPKVDTFLNPEAVSGLEVPINGLMNDRFAYKTSSDVRRTFDTKRRNGEFIGAFAPYGYAKHPEDKNALIVDEDAAQIVRNIFQWFVYGDGSTKIIVDDDGVEHEVLVGNMSKEGISRKLNELGIPNPAMYKKLNGSKYYNPNIKKNDGLWTGSAVSRILQNKVYIGTMVQGKERIISYKVHEMIRVPEEEWYQVEKTHEAIITLELFEMVQELQKKDTRAAPGKKENYLFAGFLKCADCGKAMTRRPSKTFVYYYCSTYKRKSKDKCTKHTMRLDILENAVLTAIQKQIELVESLETIIENINKAPVVQTKSIRLEELLKLCIREHEKNENLITGLYVDWKSGDITREQYRKMKAKFEQEEEQLKNKIEHLKEEIDTMKRGVATDDPYFRTFMECKNIKELSQAILMELVEVIHIHENGEITIYFKFEDEYKRIVDFIENNKNTLSIVENDVS
ncbi:recombinase family protein [Amphibacillus sp. Q70]|uniref:recombinase family protein n=1 Tax=Amphibacillus sp. Q70 TaxID=3453416 RepID=UPI003F82CE5E